MDESLLVAVVVGVVQGVLEWLPVSSEGNLAVALTAFGADPAAATRFALFVHLGTACSATVYYRDPLRETVAAARDWHPGTAFEEPTADASFLVVATLASGVVGAAAYALLDAVVTSLAGGGFVAAVGALLVVTGLVLWRADETAFAVRRPPTVGDAVLVGALQGLAVLPGVSRSGTTASALLLRGHEAPAAFRLSFLLSIPAAFGAGVLVFLDGGVPAFDPLPALTAIVVAAVVGYLTIDALLRVVERVAFPAVCVGLGGLAIAGGAVLLVV